MEEDDGETLEARKRAVEEYFETVLLKFKFPLNLKSLKEIAIIHQKICLEL